MTLPSTEIIFDLVTKKGWTQQAIATKYGVTRSAVNWRLMRYDSYNPSLVERDKAIKKAFSQGVRVKDLATKYGLSSNRIYVICKDVERAKPIRKLRPDKFPSAEELHRLNLTHTQGELCGMFGCSPKTFKRYLLPYQPVQHKPGGKSKLPNDLELLTNAPMQQVARRYGTGVRAVKVKIETLKKKET